MQSSNTEWDSTVDFVVGGAGIGGATAAITADEEGLDVTIVDKSSNVGGVSTVSGGLLWLGNNHVAGRAGIDDSAEKVETYIRHGATGSIDEPLLETFIDRAPEALEFLERTGAISWRLVHDSPDYLHPDAPGSLPEGRKVEAAPIKRAELGALSDDFRVTPHFPVGVTLGEIKSWGGLANFTEWDFELLAERTEDEYLTFGSGVMGHLLAEVDHRDIEVRTDTAIDELVQQDGRIAGVTCTKAGETSSIRARRGVLLAIGGYDWSPEKVERFESVPDMKSAAPPIVHGDHFDLTAALPVQIATRTEEGRFPVATPGVNVPGERTEGVPLYRLLSASRGCPGSIIVNEDGERFCNGAFWQDFVANIGQIAVFDGEYENWPCFLILDQDNRDSYPIAGIEPGQDISSQLGEKGDTIEELAEKLGINPSGLAETIEAFNEYARAGTDPDFRRGETTIENTFWGDPTHEPNANMAPLTTPPFYGVKLDIVASGAPSAGLRIDERARVIDIDGAPIPGLYAAGNTAAYTDTGGAYDSGLAMTRGMTYGYIAASDASGN